MRLESGQDVVVRGLSKRAQRLLSVFFSASGVKGLADLDRPACRLYAPWRAFRRCGLSELQFGGLGGWTVWWASGYGSRFPAIERVVCVLGRSRHQGGLTFWEGQSTRAERLQACSGCFSLGSCDKESRSIREGQFLVLGELPSTRRTAFIHGGTRRVAFLSGEGCRRAERASLRLSAAVDIGGLRRGGGCRFLLPRRGRRWCGPV